MSAQCTRNRQGEARGGEEALLGAGQAPGEQFPRGSGILSPLREDRAPGGEVSGMRAADANPTSEMSPLTISHTDEFPQPRGLVST